MRAAARRRKAAFGDGDVYVEQLMPRARHIEVQIVGDGAGAVIHLGERECSIQRRHQKLVEIAPRPSLDAGAARAPRCGAVRMAEPRSYRNAGTFEFLVDGGATGDAAFAFIEANPRLQVEHTVTEEVLGIDLVRRSSQLARRRGRSPSSASSRPHVPAPRGFAVQVRINMETMDADGRRAAGGGTLTAFDLPSGPGVRVDTFG